MNRCPGAGKPMFRVLAACIVLLLSACSDDEPPEPVQTGVDVKKPPAPVVREWYPTPRYPRGTGLQPPAAAYGAVPAAPGYPQAAPTGPAYTPAPATGLDDRYRQGGTWQSPDYAAQPRAYTVDPRRVERPWGALEPREPVSRQSFAGTGAGDSRMPASPEWGVDTYGGYPAYGVPAAPPARSGAGAAADQGWYPRGTTGQGPGSGAYGEYPAYAAPASPW